jgi:hypothetical protein
VLEEILKIVGFSEENVELLTATASTAEKQELARLLSDIKQAEDDELISALNGLSVFLFERLRKTDIDSLPVRQLINQLINSLEAFLKTIEECEAIKKQIGR